jgi:hypothetical protein
MDAAHSIVQRHGVRAHLDLIVEIDDGLIGAALLEQEVGQACIGAAKARIAG